MKKLVLWLGIILFLGGGILIYVSGIQGTTNEPAYPSLFAAQIYWTILAILGLILTIVGIILGIKKKKEI